MILNFQGKPVLEIRQGNDLAELYAHHWLKISVPGKSGLI